MTFDGMHIKSSTIYNKSNRNYDGFVDYGEGISAFAQDKITTEVLVVVLAGLQGH